MAQIATLKIAAISTLTLGVGLITYTSFIPMMKNNKFETETSEAVAYNQANEGNWASLPGGLNKVVTWQHWLWSITNFEQVFWNNAIPSFQQQGPYNYTQNETYQNMQYTSDDDDNEVVSASYNRWTTFQADPTKSLDTPMYLPNQGAMSMWWKKQNQPLWQTYTQMLYNMVNYWQGEWLQQLNIFMFSLKNVYNQPDDINSFLLK
jgi:hypothetical protein